MSVIGIFYGEPGTGKSDEALKTPDISDTSKKDGIVVFDMENRLKKKISRYYPEKLITLHELKLYDKEYNEDKIASFDAFVSGIKNLTLLKDSDIPYSVIIDGIGDLRDYAHEKWCAIHNRKHAKTLGDWAGVNDLVRDTLFPIINFARVHDINLIMTAQMKDDYVVIGKGEDQTSAKNGRIPSFKEFCSYNVDVLCEFWQPKLKGKIIPGQYMVTCVKSEAGSWEQNITGKNIWDVFKEKGVI